MGNKPPIGSIGFRLVTITSTVESNAYTIDSV